MRKFVLFIIIIAIDLFWTILFPGWVSIQDKVFYDKDIALHIRDSSSRNLILKHLNKLERIKNRLYEIDVSLLDSNSEIEKNFQNRIQYEDLLKKEASKYRVSGFFSAKVNLVLFLT